MRTAGLAVIPRLSLRLAWLLALWPLASGAEVAHYSVRAKIEPAAGELTATVQLQLPREQAGKPVEFLLAAPLQITSASVELVKQTGQPGQGFQGINGSAAAMVQSGRAQRYRLIAPADGAALTLSYRGKLDFGFETPGQAASARLLASSATRACISPAAHSGTRISVKCCLPST
jgi:hypothetical protein